VKSFIALTPICKIPRHRKSKNILSDDHKLITSWHLCKVQTNSLWSNLLWPVTKAPEVTTL